MQFVEKLNELGNYLLIINNDESKKLFINDILIKCRYQDGLVTIKLMRQESDDDNSQLNEWLSVYGLEDNENNRNLNIIAINNSIDITNQDKFL